MKRISPCLWFDRQAKEAAEHYVSIFPRSKVKAVLKYGDAAAKAAGQKKGSVLTVDFELDGQSFIALNGGPVFTFSEAISLSVSCKDQKEVDYYWKRLSKGGEESMCGWLKDKYGVSWQVVPNALPKMLLDPDLKKRERVMAALLKMRKLDLAKLRRAYAGR